MRRSHSQQPSPTRNERRKRAFAVRALPLLYRFRCVIACPLARRSPTSELGRQRDEAVLTAPVSVLVLAPDMIGIAPKQLRPAAHELEAEADPDPLNPVVHVVSCACDPVEQRHALLLRE